jgi:hypothetical protein
MRRIVFIALLFLGGCAFVNPKLKDDDGITRLTARVIDGVRGIPNVGVTISTPNGDTMRRFSDASGLAVFDNIMAGDYSVSIVVPPTYSALQQAHRAAITSGKTSVVTFQLQKKLAR